MRNERITRTELYELVWSEPISTLAEKFGYSDVGLSKICKRLSIPLPTRGHWARVQAGQRPRKLPLPEEDAAREFELTLLSDSEREARRTERDRATEFQTALEAGTSPPDSRMLHPLAKAARVRLAQREGWSEQGLLRSAPKEVMDIEVTRAAVDRATSLASTMLFCLEQLGATVTIDRLQGKTILELRGAKIGLKISEHVARSDHETTPAERRAMDRYINGINAGSYHAEYPSIPRHDYTPTGLLTITVLGWPQRNWRDSARTKLEKRLGSIVAGIVSLAEEVRDREQERELKRQKLAADLQRYELEMERRREEQRKYRMLRVQAKRWIAANELRAYLDFVETTALQQAERQAELTEWLAWASSKADWLDPTVLISDAILDAPEPMKPSNW